MKGVVKCDNRCELQNSVNQWPLERALRSWDMPESMSVSALLLFLFLLLLSRGAAVCYCIFCIGMLSTKYCPLG